MRFNDTGHSSSGTRSQEIGAPAVRLTLERGQSRRTSLELESDPGVTHLVIGSSSICHWRVNAPGVRSRHFRLVWFRGRLRIEDCSVGGVRVDGREVGGRLELPASAMIEFGEAALQLESIRSVARARASTPLAPAGRAEAR